MQRQIREPAGRAGLRVYIDHLGLLVTALIVVAVADENRLTWRKHNLVAFGSYSHESDIVLVAR